jgi:putative ABC transport system ATP-binding protein
MQLIAAPEALHLSCVRVERRDAAEASFLVLDVGELLIEPGTIVGLSGPSGAGKSTLLDTVCGILKPDTGKVMWGTADLPSMSETSRDVWRHSHVGFIFQEFHLIPELSVLENILLPARFFAWGLSKETRDRASTLATRMGLPDLARRAGALSRGEQQRVAIARALVHRPALILADEPTASLDAASSQVVADLLIEGARLCGATMIVATHDAALLARLDRQLSMAAGRIGDGGS